MNGIPVKGNELWGTKVKLTYILKVYQQKKQINRGIFNTKLCNKAKHSVSNPSNHLILDKYQQFQ